MKLKEAQKYAMSDDTLLPGTYWVAADKGGLIYLYEKEQPIAQDSVWNTDTYCTCLFEDYSGKKHWTKAIRKFEV